MNCIWIFAETADDVGIPKRAKITVGEYGWVIGGGGLASRYWRLIRIL